MSGPYRFHGDSTRSPLDQPKNVFSSGQPPSFKTNVNRMKTKKWVEAKKNNYDGDDWGDYDEFDEYGADTPPPQPQLPPGVHHGLEQPSRSFTDPHRSEAPAPLYGRRNSFEAGEEHRAFSATHSGYGTPSAPPEEQVSLHAGQRHPSGAGSDASDTLQHRRDFTPSAMPPPLQTRMSPPPSAHSPTSANKPLPFIRPADIYRRVEEERQRERTSMDSSRPSLDSLTSRPREEAGLGPSADEAKSPVTPQKGLHPLETVAERKSEYLPDFDMGQQAQQAHQVQAQPSAPVEPIVAWSSSPGHRLSAFDNDFWSSGPRLDAGAGFGGDVSRSNDPELRSVVDHAFTRPDDPRSVPPTPVSKPSDTDVSRSNTTSTTGISPIMSRVPSSATAPLKSQNVFGADGSTPVIAEEVSETTTPVSRPTSTAIRADSYQFPHMPAGAHSRNISASSLPRSGFATPTRADSPARSPAIEPQRTVPEPEAAVLTSLSASSTDSPTKDTPTSPETYATREADNATAMRASPDKPASELGAAEKESQRAFLESHVQSPIDTDTSRSRSQSPSKGRVHDLASKFGGVSHSRRGSTQSNVSRSSIQSWERSQDNSRPASPTKPASPERPPVIHNLSFRPKLPGQWESFATTVATPSEPGEKDATAAEPPLAPVAPPSPLNEVDLTPTTAKHPVPVTEPTKSALDPLAALKEAGAAIGEAIKASVGVGESSSNDSDDNAKSDGKIDENTERYVEIGGVYLSKPLHIERKASSIASSIPPTPPAKDTPQSGFPPPPPLKETSPEPSSLSPLDGSLRPPMIPQLSTAPSDNDTESDRLRKEIVASLSPVVSSETIASDNRISLQPLSSNLNRESSILPSEYDSYWSDREQLSPQTSRDSARDNFVLTPPSDNQPSLAARPAGGSPGLMPRFSWEETSQLASDEQVRPGAGVEGSSRPQNASTEPTPTEHQKISHSPGQQSLGFPDAYFGPEHTAATTLHEPDLTVRGRDSEKSIRSTTEPKTLKMSSPVSGLHVVNSATNPEAVDMPARLSFEGARNDEPPEYNQAKSALDSDKPHPEQQHPHISNLGPETPAPVSSSPAVPAAATPASVPGPQPQSGSQSATVDNHKPLGFRDIANIKSASERIATYTSTREYWAHADHGLADWLGSTLASHPEMHATQPLAVQIPIAPIASVRHRHTGSVGLGLFGKHHASASKADLTSPADESGGQTPGGQSGGQMAGGAGQPVTRTASFQIRETRGQMQAKGKDLLHSAGLLGGKGMTGAKGLFAKGKSRFGRSEKDPDAEPDADAHASRPSTAASSRAASPSGLDRPRGETGPETISGLTTQPIPTTHGPEMHIHELDGRILDTPAATTPKQNSSKLDIDIVAEAVASNNNHKNNDEENQQESWMGPKVSTKANTKKKRRNTDDGAGAAEGRKRRATRARSGSGYYGDAQVRPKGVGVEMEHPLFVPMPLPVFLQVSGETAAMGPAASSGIGETITSGAQEEDKSEELALPHVPAPAASAASTLPMEDLVTGSTAEMGEGGKKGEERKEQRESMDERDEESETARSLVLREVDSARESGVQESESAGATLPDTSELIEARAPLDTLGDGADGDSEELGIGEPVSDAEIGAASIEEVDEIHDDSDEKEEGHAGSVVSDVPVASETGDGTTDNIVGDLGSEQADEDELAQGPQLLNPGYFEDCDFEATQEADKLTRGGYEVDETGSDESLQLSDTPSTAQSEVASPQDGDNFESSRIENEGSEDAMTQELDSETTRPNDTARDGTGAVLQGEATASPYEPTISQRQAQIILTSDIYGGPAHATTPATRQDVSPMMPPTEPWDASIALHHAGKAQKDVSRQEEAESPVIPPEDHGDTSSESTQDGSGSEAACRSPSSNHERTIGGNHDDDDDDDDDKPPQLNHDPIPLRDTHDSFDISPPSSPKITHFSDSVRNAVTTQRPPEHRMQGMPKRHSYSPTQPQLVVITSGGFKKGASMAKSAGDTGDKTSVQTRPKYNLHAQRSERPPYETMVIGAGDVSPVSTRADHSDETRRQRFAATKAPHALSQSGQGAGAERECSEAANQRAEIATPLARERQTTPRLPSTSYAVRAVEYKPSHSSFESWEQESAAAPSQTDGSQLGDAHEEFEHAIVPDPIPRISSPSRDPALPERVGDLASAHHHTLRTVNDSPEPQHPNLPHEGKQEYLLGAESAAMSGGLKHSQSLLSAISSAVSADDPLISPASSQTEKSRPSSRARQLQSSPVKVFPVVSQISEDSVFPEQVPFRPHSQDDFDLYADQNGDVRVGGQNVRVTRTLPPTLQTPQTPPPAANSLLDDTGEARVEEDNQKRYSTDRPMSFISSPHDESGMPQDQINSASKAETPASNPPSASPQGQAITFNGAQPATPPQGDGPAPFITENKPATSPQRDGSAAFNTELQSPFSPQLQHGQRISPPDNALGPQHHPSARTVSPLPHPNASAQSQLAATQGHPQPPMVQSPSPQNSMSADPMSNPSHQEHSMFQDPRPLGPSGPLHQGLPTHSHSEGQGFVSPHGILPSQHNPGLVPTPAPTMNHQFQEQGRLQPAPGFVLNGPQYQPSPMRSQPVATPPVRAEDKHRKLPSLFKGLTPKSHPTHHDSAARADINANQNGQAMEVPVHHPPYQSRPAKLPAQQDLALNQGRPSGYAPPGKRPQSMGGESHISHMSQVSHLSQESMRVQAAGSRLDLQQSASPAPFQGIPPQHYPPPGAPIRPMPQTQVYNSSSVPEAALPGKKKRFSALGALFGRSKEEKKAQKAQRHVSALPTIPVGRQQWPPSPQQQQYVPVQQQHQQQQQQHHQQQQQHHQQQQQHHQQQQQLQQQQQVPIHQQQMPVHQHKNGMQPQPMPGQQNGISYRPGTEQQSVPLNRNLRSHPTPGHFVSPSAPTDQLRPGVQTAPSVGFQQPPQPQSVSQKPMDEQSAFQAARQNYLMQQRHEGQQSAQPRPQPSPHGGPPLSPPSAPHHEQPGRQHPPGGYFNPGTKQPPVQSAAQTPPHAQRQVVPHPKQPLAPEKPPNMRHVSSPGPQTHAPPPTQRRVTAPLVEPQYETPRIPAAYSQVSGAYVSPSAQTLAPTAWPAAPSSASPARQHSDPQMQPLSPQVSALSQSIAPQHTHSSSVASAVSSMSSPSPSTTPTNQARLGPPSQRTQPPRMTSISESAPSERPWHMNIPPGATEQDIIRIRHQQYIEQQLAAQQQQQAERKSPPPRQRHHTHSPSPQHQFQQSPLQQTPANTPAGFRELLPRNSQKQPAAEEYHAQGFEQQPPRHQSPHREDPHMQHAQSPPASAYPLPKSPEMNTPVNPLAAAIAPPPPPKIPHTPMNANFPGSQQSHNVINPYFPPDQSPNTHSAPHPQHPHQHMEDKSMDYGPPPPADSLDHAYEDSTPDEPPPSYSGSNTLECGADKQGQVPSISSSSERHRPPNIMIHDPDTERRFRPRQPSIGLLQHPQPASMAAPSSPVDMGAEVLRLQMLEQEHRAHAERLAKEATQRAAAERERVERERARARARELEQSVSRGGRVGSLRSVAGSRAGRPPGWERRSSGNSSGGAAPVARPVFELPAEEDDEPVMRATSFPGQEWVPTFVDD